MTGRSGDIVHPVFHESLEMRPPHRGKRGAGNNVLDNMTSACQPPKLVTVKPKELGSVNCAFMHTALLANQWDRLRLTAPWKPSRVPNCLLKPGSFVGLAAIPGPGRLVTNPQLLLLTQLLLQCTLRDESWPNWLQSGLGNTAAETS
ncbi:hypothetical protein PG993_007614 [Apiospora rasikravindrae]|uniref:Uncharacterized protein n=1 Tax=Apiospora rasikravindrae TaxID=990691 RepID=A0ABR1SY02_9PEZI